MKAIKMTKQMVWAFLGLSMFAGCGVDGDDTMLLPNSDGEIMIELADFTFGADEVAVQAGDTVTFVLDNVGKSPHEFMIGQNVVLTEAGEPNGFEHDFFESIVPIVVPPGAGMVMGAMDPDMDMGDASSDSAMDPDMDMDMGDGDGDGDADVHSGYMVLRQPTETARLTVTIPIDAVGEWQIGCFRDRGAHWAAGMTAQLIVNQPPGFVDNAG